MWAEVTGSGNSRPARVRVRDEGVVECWEFLSELESRHAAATVDHPGPALLAVSLDRFRLVNDTYGHAAGEELLTEVLDRLRRSLDGGDLITRLGREEFAALLPAATADQAVAAAERLLAAIRLPCAVRGSLVFLSASVGVAVLEPRGAAAMVLPVGADGGDPLCHAEVAMHHAQRAGGDRQVVFEPTMRAERRARLTLETELHQAILRDEFVVYYQPVMTLATRQIHGFEALVRWRHPSRGMVPPGEFIPVAEETGMIVPIGRVVLAEACRQLGLWRDEFGHRAGLTMSVNLSARQLRHPELIAEVRNALGDGRVPAELLILEITETSLHEDVSASTARLRELKDLGVQLAIDDFGTGYSSLSFLQQFPVDIIKIDRSFVSGMTAGPQAAAFTRAIVGLGRTLNLHTVAEGVETAEQLAGVRRAGSEFAQGFHFARPLSEVDAEGFLRSALGLGQRDGELAG
jgi:diguanylate cyclase (GGDEF)-like protein